MSSSQDRRNRRTDVLERLSASPKGSTSSSRASSPKSSPKSSDQSKGRQSQLAKVFREFDLDDSGEIESKELLELGKARRSLGQKKGVWDAEKNARLVKNMDSSGDGLVDEKEFTTYFASKLPQDAEEFSTILEQFMEVARACRKTKVEQRKQADSDSSDYRRAELCKVYQMFDLDGGGDVGDDELLVLGQTRRKLGQKQGEWTQATNTALMKKIGVTSDGSVAEGNFAKYFDGSLTSDRAEFDKTIEQFMECARACRKTKIAKREAQKDTAPAQSEAPKQPKADSAEDAEKQRAREAQKVARDILNGSSLNASSPSLSEKDRAYRQNKLNKVYQEFDLDGGGDVGDDELLVLGQTRRKLGQKEGSWTKGMNDTLMNKIGKDRNGNLPANNFVKYFDGSLASEKAEFDKTIEQFMECARACRKTKIAKREVDKQDGAKKQREAAANRAAEDKKQQEADDLARKNAKEAKQREAQAANARKQEDKQNEAQKNRDYRQAQLHKVYQEFDLDGGGDVGDDELLVLGQTRRKLGQKEGSWTKGMNDTLMNKIGKDRNGNLPANNFVKYFDGSLAGVRAEFDKTIEQFMECARACRKTKIAKREADKQAKDTSAEDERRRRAAAEEARKKQERQRQTVIDPSKACEKVLTGHTDYVLSAVFSQDGNTLVSCGRDHDLRIWNPLTGHCNKVLKGHSQSVYCCDISPDGKTVASGGHDRMLALWDVDAGRIKHHLFGHKKPVKACKFSFDGSKLLSVSYDGTVKLWDATLGTNICTMDGHTAMIRCCDFSFDGELVVSGGDDNTLRVWQVPRGKSVKLIGDHTGSVMGCAFSPNGKLLASASEDNTVRMYAVGSWDCMQVFKGHTSAVFSCSFAPDSLQIATSGDDLAIRCWDVATGKCVAELQGHQKGCFSCSFTSATTRRLLATASHDETLRIWNLGIAEEEMVAALALVKTSPPSPSLLPPSPLRVKSVAPVTKTPDAADDAKWAARAERASQRKSTQQVLTSNSRNTTANDDAKWREREERAKAANASKQEDKQNEAQKNRDYRQAQLHKVYQEFDLDGGGDVGDDELLVLGQTRRKLGQKEGSWTKGMNDTLMNKIGKDRNGNLPANNFVKYFDGSLAGVRAEFDKTIEQFMECARACRKTKIAKREADKQAKDTRARPSAARSAAPPPASASLHKAPSEPRSASRPANGSARNGPSSAVSSPSRVASPKLDRATSRRHAALRGVFRKFDLDRGGYVEAQELMVLGKARRTLGQKSGEWNEEKNTKLIKRMDTNGDGQISENEFIEFFSNALPQLPFEFETTVSQFLKVAESVKK